MSRCGVDLSMAGGQSHGSQTTATTAAANTHTRAEAATVQARVEVVVAPELHLSSLTTTAPTTVIGRTQETRCLYQQG